MRRAVVLALGLACSGCGGDSKPPAPPEDLAVVEARGVSLLERYDANDLDKAVETLGSVVKRAPEWRDARVNHAIALAAVKKPEASQAAITECARVLAEDPRNPHALFVTALAKRFLGKTDEAVPFLERLMDVDPDEPSVWYWLGTVEMEGTREDLARAEQYFRRALALSPSDLSSTYGLFQALARQGKADGDEAKALLATFRGADEAKGFGSGAFAKHVKRGDQEYGEGGKYGRAIRDFAAPTGAAFSDATASSGFKTAVGGRAGLACGDVDGDGDDDLYLVSSSGRGVVYRNDRGTFAESPAPPAAPNATAALFADVDEDGRLDLTIAGDGVRILRNAADAKWEEIPAEKIAGGAGAAAALTWADVDHDGDIDLVVAGPKARWLRNKRDGTFEDASAEKHVVADASTSVVAFDADGDSVTDLVFFGAPPGSPPAPPRLLLNGRLGTFAADARLDALGPAVSGTVGDVDGDGNLDLLLVRPDGALALAKGNGRGAYGIDVAFPALRIGASFAAVADFDDDGRPDVLAVGKRVTLVRGLGNGRYAVEGTNLPEVERSAIAISDFDGDGDLDVVLAEAGGPLRYLRNEAPRSRHALRLRLKGVPDRVEGRTWSNVRGIGAEVDVKAGDLVARRIVLCGAGFPGQATTDVRVGLGDRARADFALVHWTDGVLQNEYDVPPDTTREIVEVNRKIASCPVVFAWDGTGFRYVTDCLGVGGLGFYTGPAIGYAPPDPTEVLRLPTLAPKDGAYVVSLVENLEEVSYLDEARLLVVDHPSTMDVNPDERFAVEEPFPKDVFYGAEERIFPATAKDDSGGNVLPLLLEEDRRTVDTFPLDRRFIGVAKPHALELDFGDRLAGVAAGDRLVMFLTGWIEYGYSKTYVATAQAGVDASPPVLEVPDGPGGSNGWKKAAAIGYPAGNSRTMTYDVTGILGPHATRCRIRSSLEVYWDRIFVARDRAAGRLRVTTLPVASAHLAVRGYPREFSPDGRAPTLYDHGVCESWIPFRTMPGDYTQFGVVTPLLASADDEFVIFGKGEEVTLSFDGGKVAPPAPGESRTFFLRLDGYCKDRDPYTALGDTVEPLPFHAMSNYPYAAKEHYPDDAVHRDYRARWNTRVVR